MNDAAESSRTGDQASGELVGRVVAERFRVDELIGTGAMGAVYRAFHVHTRKHVALKVLHHELTGVEEVVARFEREAVAAGRVEHPNVAGALDFGRLADGTFYLVLEYVKGERLRNVLASGPLPIARAVPIARQVALALGAAHAAGIVHRDLKPDNVMLLERDGADFVKVLDFGVAKVSADAGAAQITRMGTIIGTPDYMSPEQALGHAVDHRADLYALGVMLYEMLTGKTPFSSDDVTQVLMAQITATPEPLPDTVPAPVRDVVQRLLAKEPEARVQTAADAVAAIDGASAAPSPVSAPSSYLASAVSTVSPQSAAPEVSSSGAAGAVRRLPKAVWVGGAVLVVLGFALTLTMGKEASPPLTLAPANANTSVGSAADQLLKKTAEPSVVPAHPAPSAEWSRAEADPETPPAASTTKPARASKATAKPAKKPPQKKPQRRRTGPGGIYIPPPSEWF
jgi:eukaryotic-like serine/threonine-protein kinase